MLSVRSSSYRPHSKSPLSSARARQAKDNMYHRQNISILVAQPSVQTDSSSVLTSAIDILLDQHAGQQQNTFKHLSQRDRSHSASALTAQSSTSSPRCSTPGSRKESLMPNVASTHTTTLQRARSAQRFSVSSDRNGGSHRNSTEQLNNGRELSPRTGALFRVSLVKLANHRCALPECSGSQLVFYQSPFRYVEQTPADTEGWLLGVQRMTRMGYSDTLPQFARSGGADFSTTVDCQHYYAWRHYYVCRALACLVGIGVVIGSAILIMQRWSEELYIVALISAVCLNVVLGYVFIKSLWVARVLYSRWWDVSQTSRSANKVAYRDLGRLKNCCRCWCASLPRHSGTQTTEYDLRLPDGRIRLPSPPTDASLMSSTTTATTGNLIPDRPIPHVIDEEIIDVKSKSITTIV